jgi:hypothetical protein
MLRNQLGALGNAGALRLGHPKGSLRPLQITIVLKAELVVLGKRLFAMLDGLRKLRLSLG